MGTALTERGGGGGEFLKRNTEGPDGYLLRGSNSK